jgi:hypothetical protein
MTRRLTILVWLLAGLPALGAAQSLGDAARKAREQKKESGVTASKVYTNETLGVGPREIVTTGVAEAGSSAPAEGAEPKAKEDGSAEDAEKKAAEEKAKREEELIKQVADAKKELEQLLRELDVYQREAKVQATVSSMDVGERVRNERQYLENLQKAQSEVAGKKAAVDAAQKKLESLREQARRANIPPGKIP